MTCRCDTLAPCAWANMLLYRFAIVIIVPWHTSHHHAPCTAVGMHGLSP